MPKKIVPPHYKIDLDELSEIIGKYATKKFGKEPVGKGFILKGGVLDGIMVQFVEQKRVVN